jgi:hypothetical protein
MSPLPLGRLSIFALSLVAAAAIPVRPGVADAPVPPAARGAGVPAPRKPIDLVLCLDTSGSMTGLIHAARQKMWEVVNELAAAKPMPRLRVALLTYGSPGNDEAGHVVLQTDLTEDLDLVSERLFALGTSGGNEYVGRVVRTALERLSWADGDAAKILFVAGNESADQDRAAPFREVVKTALGRGVRVNSIYCGNPDDADAPGWREVASLGGGRYASIDHNAGTVAVATPFDKELEELSKRINGTYVAYGRDAAKARERQTAQDANAAAAPAAGAARAESKGSDLYRNPTWDLVDRMDEAGFDLATLPDDQVPEEMKKLDLAGRREFLAKKKAERADLKTRIQELGAKRQAHVKAEMEKRGLDDSKALDRAVRDAVREQAAAKGFEFGAAR